LAGLHYRLPSVITALIFAAKTFKFKPLPKEVFMIKTRADVHIFMNFSSGSVYDVSFTLHHLNVICVDA